MTRLAIIVLAALASTAAFAGILDVFELEDGHTNWQYVANTSGTLLILALSYTLFRLVMANREAGRYNRELEAIRSELEDRVAERTATLDESNRLLQDSNAGLEAEITEHRATAERLQQSEAYIANILHSMPEVLIGLNNDGNVTQWNRRAAEVTGVTAQNALGQWLWRVYPTITVTPNQIEQAKRSRRPMTVKQSQRGQFHFDVTIYPLAAPSETGVVVMINDVTQQVLTENMLIQRDKMSSMGELAGSLAQDISTPLHAMMMDVREVQSRIADIEYGADKDPADLLDDALLRGEQVSAVVSNLLQFTSANAGDMQRAAVTPILEHALEIAAVVLTVPAGLKFEDIRIERDYEEGLPQVPCYPAELQQVFLSLLRHCCQALGEVQRENHDPVIKLTANKFYDALWLKIQHNGKGLTLEEQQFLFEPFFNDGSGIKQEDYDAGRRLSYPYFIVTEQHGGQLAVTSEVGIGTTFHLQLLLD